ncbi:AMP-binding protein [Sphingosinicella rhizophila]|uniref:AMP-binding protein n=1 Tax=Sphingosinicella rhizophila TaxID=3050082 RepID=A0ABU3Q6V2_9SPHN|nr:AMP-binding protein [Sphingosinicella sp. GR2756]MDT9598708.1 AMP-binding protein [Sphingosinicella sp. GR2756]
MFEGDGTTAGGMSSTAFSESDLLIHSLSYDLDRPVVTFADTGRVVDAREFRDVLSRYVQALKSRNLARGTRVGLISRNRPEVLFVHGAMPFTGLTIVPLHPGGSVDDIAYAIEDAQIEALIFDSSHYHDMARALDGRLPHLNHFLALGPTEIGEDLTKLAESFAPQPLVRLHRDPEEIVRLGYSGGTTGQSKGITFSSRCLLTMMDIMLKEWEWPDEIRHLICSPLSHAGGVIFTPTMVKHGSMIVLPGFDATAVLEAIEKYRINSMLVVPTMIYSLLDHPRLKDYDLSSLEVIYYGSSLISPSRLKEAIETFGPIFFQFYGQAEAPMTVTVMKRADHDPTDLNRLASCGRPVPWVRVQLMDDDDKPVEDGEPGEICVQGPLLMSGYLNKPEQTAEAFAGGWLHTGDVAVRDPDGFLRIVDRKKDMIVTGGFNVYPREVEDVLTSHAAVAAAAVIGVPHERWGEAVKAVVVLRDGAIVSEAELIALVRARKGAVQAPKSVLFTDRIRLSSVGKPDKKALRASFRSTES